MNKNITICFLLLILGFSVQAEDIAVWNLFGQSSAATATATTWNANLNSSNLITRGPTAVVSTGTNSFRSNGFKNDGISVDNSDYFQITLSVSAGNLLSLSTINANLSGTISYTAEPGVSSQFAYSLNGTDFTLIGSAQIISGNPQSLAEIDLSGITELQGIAPGTCVTLRYYASGQTATGGWGFNSRASTSNALTIGGTTTPPSTEPMITIDQSSLNFSKIIVNKVSSEKILTVSGSNLTDNVTVSTPAGFEISQTSGSGFGSGNIVLTPESGIIPATAIYIRFAPVLVQDYSGDITLSTAGAAAKNIAVTGTGLSTDYLSFVGFEDETMNGWSAYSVAGIQNWSIASAGANSSSKSAEMNGFGQTTIACNDWLISPAINLSPVTEGFYSLDFYSQYTYGSDNSELTLKYSSDYSGSGDPSTSTWTALNFTQPEGPDSWISSGNIDLSAITTFPVYFAYQYLGVNDNLRRWRIDEIAVKYNAGSAIDNHETIASSVLLSNYPNPFNPTTVISYKIISSGTVDLAVYNAKGELVQQLVNNFKTAGLHSVNFDAAGMNSGVYFYKLTTNGSAITNKMLLVK